MADLFDSPRIDSEIAQRRYHQHLSDLVDACRSQAYSTSENVTFSNEIARLLVDLAENQLPHRPLSNSGKYARDLVIWRWRKWRREQTKKNKLDRKTATLQAVQGATAEIVGLAKLWGTQIVLKETTVKDRVCRAPTEAPRLQFWWEKR